MQILRNRSEVAETKDRRKKPSRKGAYAHVPKKLAVLFFFILLAFMYLSFVLFRISYDSEETYKKQVLSQLSYDSKTLPFRRGDILDAATGFQIPNRTGMAQIPEVNVGELRSLQYLLVEAANHRR